MKYIHTYIHTYIVTYIHTYIYIYIHTYIHIYNIHIYYVHIYVQHTYTIHIYIYIYIHIYIYIYIHIYICTYVRTYLHTYIHTYSCWKNLFDICQREIECSTSHWWFILYGLCSEQVKGGAEEGSVKDFVESLQRLMETSCIGEFMIRLEMIMSFSKQFDKGSYY